MWRRVIVQQLARKDNSFGEQTAAANDWQEVCSLWAEVTPLSANERIRGQAAQLTTTHKVRMRYSPEVKADRRLAYTAKGSDARVLNIQSIINEGDEYAYLSLLCSEVTK